MCQLFKYLWVRVRVGESHYREHTTHSTMTNTAQNRTSCESLLTNEGFIMTLSRTEAHTTGVLFLFSLYRAVIFTSSSLKDKI